MRNRFWWSLLLTVPVLLYSETIQGWFGFTMPTFPGSEFVPAIFGTLIFIFGGLVFLNMARHEIQQGQPGMMTLISLAITTAYTYSLAVALGFGTGSGFFWELVTLIDVMLLGHWIEMRSVGQAQSALKELSKLMPDEAERITESGNTETVRVSELSAGDKVLVRPGASIPADGEVYEGDGKVDESMITGESKPVDKAPGDEVVGGTVNKSGALRIEITKTGDETALAGIMRLVEDAQQSKSRAQSLAQKAAFYLTLIAVGAGILTFAGWLLLANAELPFAIQRTVTVLVIACPHALGLAVPLVVAISTTLSARNGVLVRQRMALESARNLDTIVFDKTGTLTKGEQGVVTMQTADSMSEDEVLKIAAAVERDSEHPIAKAILAHADERNVQPAEASDFDNIEGRGVQATVNDTRYFVGGPRLLEQRDITPPDNFVSFREEAGDAGQAAIYLLDEQQILAAFAIADVIRPESRAAIEALHEMGLNIAMMTGDSDDVARHVADELGIDTYFAEVLPENKADKVKSLQEEGQSVAMVGDGVNDAPALVQADVGIAIGAGTDVAVESAGIILVGDDPRDIVKVIKLSHATHRKTIQNLFWATGYNVIAIPLAMGILAPIGFILPPAVGAAVMSVSTVIVAINAMLLRNLDLSDVVPETRSSGDSTPRTAKAAA
jgi:Cu2+-exporting ATPase